MGERRFTWPAGVPLEGGQGRCLGREGRRVASIRKLKSGRYQVRWREGGEDRSRGAPSLAIARELQRQVEAGIALSGTWQPAEPGGGAPLTLTEVLRQYVTFSAAAHAPNTCRQVAMVLDVFARWVAEHHAQAEPRILSRGLLADFRASLLASGLRESRAASTANAYVSIVFNMWRWASEEEAWDGLIPFPRRLRVPAPPGSPTVAPTWAEMDRCIGHMKGTTRDLCILLRFTGLRHRQAAALTWADVDLDAGLLVVRGELGKSREERRGRRVPLSPHLVAILQTWKMRPERGGPLLVPRAGKQRTRTTSRAWRAAGVREEIWKKRPHHAFRKGFVSELARGGANLEAVEILVGHSRGVRGLYADPSALPLRQAVELIPPLSLAD